VVASTLRSTTHLTPEVFLEVVNEVLKNVGRDPLEPGGPQQQVIAVNPTDVVLQILAGPGSGKTEMLVWRVLYELLVNATPSQRLLVTTFTRRAATELQVRMVERCDAALDAARRLGYPLLDPKVHDLRIGTIHSLCDTLLVEFDTSYMSGGIQVIDEAETMIRIARDHRYALGYSNPPAAPRVLNRLFGNDALVALFRAPWEDDTAWPNSVMSRASCTLAMLAQHIETWAPRCEKDARPNGVELVHGPVGLTDDLVKLHERWASYLDEHNIIDFASIQRRFLESQDAVAAHLSHVFVDEFQDNNPIQFALHTGWLRQAGIRLTVVGDDDQAIYRFRGSDIGCFNQLEPFCEQERITYRLGKLETNHRSTRNIIAFASEYRDNSALRVVSMPKEMYPSANAVCGPAVRLLEGQWDQLCQMVAAELDVLGVGRHGESKPPSGAILMFSTSERSSKAHIAPATTMRQAIEAKGMRAYNPRSKMAAASESPVSQLLGLVSYLIDPISIEPVGKGGRNIMVAASMGEKSKSKHADTAPPPFFINDHHLDLQKKFFKSDGGDIGAPSRVRKPVIELVDSIRANLVASKVRRPRLTLAGFISRLIALPFFRDVGFSISLFRQALFPELLEANLAANRRTMQSLDHPLNVVKKKGQYVWEDRFWRFLGVFGSYLDNTSLDDPEVESFEDNAVLLLTFHQTKGLEFDHVYVAGSGRPADFGRALRTTLFSGEVANYKPTPLTTRNKTVQQLATADRDREAYVAITRARQSLTVLHDPQSKWAPMALNPAMELIFRGAPARPASGARGVTVKEFTNE